MKIQSAYLRLKIYKVYILRLKESNRYSLEGQVSEFVNIRKESIPGLDVANVAEKLILFSNSTADVLVAYFVKDSNNFY